MDGQISASSELSGQTIRRDYGATSQVSFYTIHITDPLGRIVYVQKVDGRDVKCMGCAEVNRVAYVLSQVPEYLRNKQEERINTRRM